MKKIKKIYLEAVEYLMQNPTKTVTAVAQQFQMDRHTLSDYWGLVQSGRLNKSNLFESHKANDAEFLYYFSDEELAIITYYEQNSDKPYIRLKEKYPKAPDVRALRNWMDILGKAYHTGAIQKYHYNSKSFENIVSEADAYWLGFITADGCIVENSFLQLKLAEKDRGHLVKFCQYLSLPDSEIEAIIKNGVGGAITKDNPISVVKICNKSIIQNLQDKGINPRKSGMEKPYKCSSIALETAYIRGLLDGDGYLRFTQYGMGLVGSYEICKYVRDFINDNVSPIENESIYPHDSIWKFAIAGRLQTSKILSFFYDNASVYLDRKYKLYQEKYYNN